MALRTIIDDIIREIGFRPSGSEAEAAAAGHIARDLENRGADVSIEELPCRLEYIPGFANIMVGTFLAVVLIYPFAPAVSALLTVCTLVMFLLTKKIGNRAIDWMFKKGTTQNVVGVVPAQGEKKHTLIFSGHHDSPDMMPILSPPYKGYVHIIETVAVTGFALMLPAGLLRAIFGGLFSGFPPHVGWYDLLYPLCILGLAVAIFYRANVVSGERNLGANDNLSAVAVLGGVADYLAANPAKRTEVMLVSFGSEESGCYGSHHFTMKNPDLIKSAVNINMETVGAGELAVIEKERNSGIAYSPEAVDLIRRAGDRAGIPLEPVTINFGATDSYPQVKAGGCSSCLFGMDKYRLFTMWHSPLDVPKNVSEENLQKALSVCIEAIKIAEEEGLVR